MLRGDTSTRAAHRGQDRVELRRRADWPDQLLTILVWIAAGLVTIALLWIIGDLLWRGSSHLSFEFLLTTPSDAGRAGGITPILLSTLLILCITLAASVPVALCTAVLLSEFLPRGEALGTLVRRSLDVLAGVPSIVFGLFGNAFFVIWLGLGYSILAGGLTLACMVLPILVRSTEEGLRGVPDEYRAAAVALGLSRSSLLRRVLLPSAVPGLMTGLTLGIGRALAETAALLFTSGYVDRMPDSPMDSGRALSIHIDDLAMNVPGGDRNAYAAAIVLLALLIAINVLTHFGLERCLHRKVTLP